jgi:hypothetical protein
MGSVLYGWIDWLLSYRLAADLSIGCLVGWLIDCAWPIDLFCLLVDWLVGTLAVWL